MITVVFDVQVQLSNDLDSVLGIQSRCDVINWFCLKRISYAQFIVLPNHHFRRLQAIWKHHL